MVDVHVRLGEPIDLALEVGQDDVHLPIPPGTPLESSASVKACGAGKCMIPRSSNDKEYFAQDWFIDRLNALSVPFAQQDLNRLVLF